MVCIISVPTDAQAFVLYSTKIADGFQPQPSTPVRGAQCREKKSLCLALAHLV